MQVNLNATNGTANTANAKIKTANDSRNLLTFIHNYKAISCKRINEIRKLFPTTTNSCIAPSQIMKKVNLYIEGIISYIEDEKIV